MNKPAPAFTFETWSAPQAPLVIEYPVDLMDELRAAACDSSQHFPRGGLEVGGVLFGARKETRIRVHTWRPIACEHAYGPAFVLSQKDRAGLSNLLDSVTTDPDLRWLQPVGWFVSHTRTAVCLSAAEVEIHSQFFPWSWQAALVLHPERLGVCCAGFFVRDAAGGLRSDSSYREFSIRPLDRPPAQSSLLPAGPPEAALPSQPAPVPVPPRQPVRASTPSPAKWSWLIVGLVLIVAAVLLKDRILPTRVPNGVAPSQMESRPAPANIRDPVPPLTAADVLALQQERDQLKAEVERLREELRKEKSRAGRRRR